MNTLQPSVFTLDDIANVVEKSFERNFDRYFEKNFEKAWDRKEPALVNKIEKIIDVKIEELAVMTGKGFNEITERFNEIDRRFEQVDRRFDRVDTRLTKIESIHGGYFKRLKSALTEV